MTPFLTFYTPSFRRPQGLARCLASVQAQTAVESIEHIVIPDHLGVGVGGMFARIQQYADAVHGRYVHILCDDDFLASTTVVACVESFAEAQDYPELIIVDAEKGGSRWPTRPAWPPRFGYIDLGCGIVRADVWKRHVAEYQPVYEGDFTFFQALADAGVKAAHYPILFSVGLVSHGAAEATA